ncbi:hypothetical protein [Pelagibius sp. Alg239-R121]|uniref:hypothetical protein n=1 Tax=Pelagibius sp. Alg239-R121 TaxID=2993448 RepID=UPI0024A6B9A6|nr:hypothetical protein [Pelagibius sp. Alg239-R121]
MYNSDAQSPTAGFFAWTTQLAEDFREEVLAIHIQALDRSFFATTKGMTYSRVEKIDDSSSR